MPASTVAWANDLLVMGVTSRSGDTLYFGTVPSAVLQKAPESVLLVAT
jgi:nucleotide-binding universal stress UspA family protein